MNILGNLTGMFFHIIENGEIQYQGMIDRQVDEWYYVRLFNWISGGWDGKEKLYKLEDMKNWVFYKTNLEMLQAYQKAEPGEDETIYTKRPAVDKNKNSTGLSLRYKVLSRDKHTCRSCGRSVDDGVKLEVDHVYPKSLGGKATIDNLQVLCFDCNRGKRDKMI